MTNILNAVGGDTGDSGHESSLPLLFGSITSIRKLENQAEYFVARALTMMERARRLVEADRKEAIPLLNACRIRLGTHFKSYQIFKHSKIFDPVITFGPASSKIVARGMKVDCWQLGETYGTYTDRWRRLHAKDWASYRRDMLEIVDILVVSLQAELRAMRQLLMIAKLRQA